MSTDTCTTQRETPVERQGLTPLEQLPPSLFCEIAKYLLVVEYDDEQQPSPAVARLTRRPFICHVKLRRGYALAVCSRRCHELFEESAKLFLCAYTPSQYFLPNEPIFLEKPSFLAQFYRIKGMEVSFRYESKCLKDMMVARRRGAGYIKQETDILRQVERVLSGPLVKCYASNILSDCVRACARVLRCENRNPTRATRPDPGSAAAAVFVLEKIVSLKRLQVGGPLENGHVFQYSTPDALSLLYLANLKSKTPSTTKAGNALRDLLDELVSPKLPKTGILQDAQLNAYRELFYLNLSVGQNDTAFQVLQRARETTKKLDPINLWTFTKLVKDHAKTLGLDRSTNFLVESVDEFHSIQTPSEELQWKDNRYSAANWYNYKQNCSVWLRELQDEV